MTKIYLCVWRVCMAMRSVPPHPPFLAREGFFTYRGNAKKPQSCGFFDQNSLASKHWQCTGYKNSFIFDYTIIAINYYNCILVNPIASFINFLPLGYRAVVSNLS